jgi:putative alpha-1,2-mannosidase
MWNYMGIFPASGYDYFFLGCPSAKSSKISLWNGNTFEIVCIGEGDTVKKVTLNGKPVDGYSISVKDFMQGGTLTFYK